MLNDHFKVEGVVDLGGAKIGGDLEIESSSFNIVRADELDVAGRLLMNDHAAFEGDLTLAQAKVGQTLDMGSSSFAAPVDVARLTTGGDLVMNASLFSTSVEAEGLNIGGGLFMRDHARFSGDVRLLGAKITGDLDMIDSSFTATVIADGLNVGGALLMRGTTFNGNVRLRGAKIGQTLEMDSGYFAADVDGQGLDIRDALFMRNHAKFDGNVSLHGAKVGSDLELDTSSFAKALSADGLHVEGDVSIRQARLMGPVSLISAQIGGILDLRGATATRLDLSDASAKELVLGPVPDLGWSCADTRSSPGSAGGAAPKHWQLGDPSWQQASCNGSDIAALPELTLRNAHFGALQDGRGAWPPVLGLEGFRYDRLGGLYGVGRDDMRRRTPDQWSDWLARDRIFSTQPYAQLSAVLLAAGHRDTAEAIQLAGQERERADAWANHDGSRWLWLTILGVGAGYGIGLYTFRVLWWVLALTFVGALMLRRSPVARCRSVWWQLGASLQRLLPFLELSKEFKDFFENTAPQSANDPRNLTNGQSVFFAIFALIGWVLGFLLLAAMSALIQKV